MTYEPRKESTQQELMERAAWCWENEESTSLAPRTLEYARAYYVQLGRRGQVEKINEHLRQRLLQDLDEDYPGQYISEPDDEDRATICRFCGLPFECVNPEQGEARCVCD